MSETLISIEERLSDDDRRFILAGLDAYNDKRSSQHNYRHLSVVSRQEGRVVGGLLGHTHWKWLYVKILWVADGFRGYGIGRDLMLAAEREASQRGCRHAHCSTFSFQALPFYQKLGYTIFGALDDYPDGQPRYFLQKRKLSTASTG